MVRGKKLHDMWAMPFWNMLGVWLLYHILSVRNTIQWKYYKIFLFIMSTCVFIASIWSIVILYRGYVLDRPMRVHFPGKDLAYMVTDSWKKSYHTPLSVVMGDPWIAGNVAYYALDRPRLLTPGDPIVKPEHVFDNGAVYLWCSSGCYGQDMLDPLREPLEVKNVMKQYQHKKIIYRASVPWKKGGKTRPIDISWVMIPPKYVQ
jgi:hypothetical protein